MKKIIGLLFMVTAIQAGRAQKIFDAPLKRQLDSVYILDQQYRAILSNGVRDSVQADSLVRVLKVPAKNVTGALWKRQNALDSSNLIFVEGIFGRYGYPGKSLVDTPTCEAAWNVIQHSPKIDRYIDLIKDAAEAGELPYRLYATMYDRYLTGHRQEQVYGTQVSMLHLKSGENDWFVWPISDPANVNKLREVAGFKTTVEENAIRLDVKYRVIKMSDIKW